MPPSVQDAEVVVKRGRGRPPSTNKAVAAPKVATVVKLVIDYCSLVET